MHENEAQLKADVRRVITSIFGTTSASGFIWTEESWKRARALVNVPTLDEDFIQIVTAIFHRFFPNNRVYALTDGHYPWGHAWAIEACDEDATVEGCYLLLICRFYPVTTLCYRNRFQKDRNGYPDPDAGSDTIRATMAEVSVELERVMNEHGYMYLPATSEVFQQWIPAGFLSRVRAWNYLFYLGPPYE